MKNTVLALLCGFGVFASSAAKDKISETTMSNLQAAFNGESNAHAQYLAFAKKADAEGYRGVASLFRAAARAEEIHAANHANVINKFGGRPRGKLESAMVGSTRENLAAAIKGETYERDEMYPAFVRQAQRDGNIEAIQTLSFALTAEAEHAKLYKDALANLEQMSASRVFYVCPTCGFTTASPEFERCPTCATPKERFEQIS
jgi:rubrerythrin